MKRDLACLQRDSFDVLVIGGGISGAWIALDCALRGMRVALIDKADFGGATSAASSKLLHGGIRYLQQLNFAKVRQSALERANYLVVAPHLSHFVPFLVPTYSNLRQGKLLLRSALAFYAMLCSGENRRVIDHAKRVPRATTCSAAEVLERIPFRDKSMSGGVVFYESHMESAERMTLAVISQAYRHGVIVANYVEVTGLLEHNGRIHGVSCTDVDGGDAMEIRAALTVNAAGPWISGSGDRFSSAANRRLTTGFSQGSHLVTKQLIADYAIALPTEQQAESLIDRGGRHIFIIPWRGHSLIGTSYAPLHGDIDHVHITDVEIDQLLGEVNKHLPELGVGRSDIVHAYSGVYPLRAQEIRAGVYQGTGDYQLVDHSQLENREGLLTAMGAKYTTARLLAEKTTDRVVRHLGVTAPPCATMCHPIAGGDIPDLAAFESRCRDTLRNLVAAKSVPRLIRAYGSDVDDIAARIQAQPNLAEPVGPEREVLAVELDYAVDVEMALHLEDVLYRRTGIGTIGFPGHDYVRRCADLVAVKRGWSSAQRDREIAMVTNAAWV
ncbi:MAG: glycerol-3-phosphate dehydrogenase/oxidase [Gammaproteobacteria bacterium]|nr:glycerol-3-phosphate dehydrogenase/oxidase [Gammaproteobacteria bacterium]